MSFKLYFIFTLTIHFNFMFVKIFNLLNLMLVKKILNYIIICFNFKFVPIILNFESIKNNVINHCLNDFLNNFFLIFLS